MFYVPPTRNLSSTTQVPIHAVKTRDTSEIRLRRVGYFSHKYVGKRCTSKEVRGRRTDHSWVWGEKTPVPATVLQNSENARTCHRPPKFHKEDGGRYGRFLPPYPTVPCTLPPARCALSPAPPSFPPLPPCFFLPSLPSCFLLPGPIPPCNPPCAQRFCRPAMYLRRPPPWHPSSFRERNPCNLPSSCRWRKTTTTSNAEPSRPPTS